MDNIIVLGGSGYVASKIKKYWKNSDFNLIFCPLKDFNYLDSEELVNLISVSKAKYIINCYGYTGKPNVDSCELNKEECYSRNVDHNLFIHIHSTVPVITISSGCIYNTDSGELIEYTEACSHNFGHSNPTASHYSRTKSKFEQLFKDFKLDDRDYILRIRMPFDDDLDDPKNYIGKLLKYNLKVNYLNSLTHLEDLTRFIEIIVSSEVETGVYNVVNAGGINTDTILSLNAISYIDPKVYDFFSTDDLLSMGMMNCRRSNCVLSTDKIKKYYDIPKAIDRVKEVLSK